jgi:hypothetical protein
MKLCRDCKHAHKKFFQRWRDATCRRSDHGPINPVDGKPQYAWDDECTSMRHKSGACGSDARLFEPKE